ncbi:hypothetical protein [Adhaeretor mobilis]|uniref:Uncharacterized protein n=1 Tax=Adhaeretor mobilis TaxID=1930276 RepID=A0A517MRG9_9BACT|nr:hypothetical protein [Adhaeretor mobilis]QDS97483.1 hypothetical protein HG15A2_07440 [Adhaeretor mobilis]
MRQPSPNARLLTWLTFGAVALWCLLLALGSFLGLDNKTPSYDWRRMAVMLGSSGFFLGLWLLAMGMRARRIRREEQAEEAANRPSNE